MKSYNIYSIFALCLINTSCVLAGNNYPEGKVKVDVRDENSTPVQNANVRIGFRPNSYVSNWYKKGKTNKQGTYEAQNKTNKGIPIRVEKEGYYKSSGGVKYESVNRILNQWEPYPAHISITLRKKKNPIPMYARKLNLLKVPVFGKSVGFDLEKGDWVKPYGKGKVGDLLILYKGQQKLKDKWNAKASMTLSFSNKLDGIQKYNEKKFYYSDYVWPYTAPQKGYKKEISKFIKFEKNKGASSNIIEKNCRYLFRVRTKTDKSGEIISANYGKIEGDFEIGYTGEISFTYYFNPDPHSRSLEFDPDKNLFKFTKDEWEHEVREP